MEYYWSLVNNSNTNSTSTTSFTSGVGVGVGGHNSNCSNNHAWESWELGGNINMNSSTTPYNSLFYHGPTTSAARQAEASAVHALMLPQRGRNNGSRERQPSTSPSSLCLEKGSHYYNPDPHLMCLKLGKRHYFEDVVSPLLGDRHVAGAGPGPAAPSLTKKGKLNDPSWVKPSATPPTVVVPKCQVEGCETVLVNAKDYHRRHKVCEMHAKAPKVVVLGIEQRFCQQCSRFHTVEEFDETKRSCRRRLAGHNERRRKSSQQHSLAKKTAQEIKLMGANRYNGSNCALSLLSSTNNNPCWNVSTSTDLPARCSAALRDLIAENRASIFGCTKQRQQHLNFDLMEEYFCKQNGSDPRFLNSQQSGSGHLTLDLMQAPDPPSSAFGMLSVHDNSNNNNNNKSSKEGNDQQECPNELWKLPLGY